MGLHLSSLPHVDPRCTREVFERLLLLLLLRLGVGQAARILAINPIHVHDRCVTHDTPAVPHLVAPHGAGSGVVQIPSCQH